MNMELPEFPPQPLLNEKASPKKDGLGYIILAAVLIALGILGSYFYTFRDRPISHEGSEWSALGSYASGLIGPLFSLLGAILIYKTFQSQKRNSDLQQFESTIQHIHVVAVVAAIGLPAAHLGPPHDAVSFGARRELHQVVEVEAEFHQEGWGGAGARVKMASTSTRSRRLRASETCTYFMVVSIKEWARYSFSTSRLPPFSR